MYPLMEILRPGPISKGMLENKARLGADLELMFDKSDCNRVRPSPLAEALEALVTGAGASGSDGMAL